MDQEIIGQSFIDPTKKTAISKKNEQSSQRNAASRRYKVKLTFWHRNISEHMYLTIMTTIANRARVLTQQTLRRHNRERHALYRIRWWLLGMILGYSPLTQAKIDFQWADPSILPLLIASESTLHSDNPSSLATAQKALEVARANHDHRSEIYALISLGQAHEANHDIKSAGKYYVAAMDLQKSTQALSDDANASFFLADGLRAIKKYDEAHSYLQNGITLKRQINDQAYLMHAYDLQSSLYYSQKKYQESINSSAKSLELAKTANATNFSLRAYRKISQAFKKLKNYAQALNSLKQGIALGEKLDPDSPYLMHAYDLQSSLLTLQNQHKGALDSSVLSLRIARQQHDNAYRLRALRKIAQAAKKLRDFTTASNYLKQGIDLQTELLTQLTRQPVNQQTLIDDAHNYLMHAYDSQSSLLEEQNNFQGARDAGLAELKHAKALQSHEFILRAYRKIAQACKNLGDYSTSLTYNLKALAIVKLDNNEQATARYLEYIATDQRALGQYSQALENAKRALEVQRRYHDDYRVSNLLLNISIIYLKLSSYDDSLKYALELLAMHEKSGDANRIAAANNQVGRILTRLNRDADAASYHLRTLSLDRHKVKNTYVASAQRSLAEINLKNGNYKAALDYANQAGFIYRQMHQLRGEATTTFTKAEIYSALNQWQKAIENYQDSIHTAAQVDDHWSEARAWINMGELLIDHEPNRARTSLRKGLNIATTLKVSSLQRNAYYALMKLERHDGNLEKSLAYYDDAYTLMQQIDSQEIDQRVAELKVVHELEKNEREIDNLKRNMKISELELSQQSSELEVLNSKNTIAELKLEQEKSKFFIMAAIVLLIALILAFVFMRYRYATEAQKILNDRNIEIEKNNRSLSELNHTKDRFFSIISHDLRRPISAIVARTDMLNDNFDNLDQEQLKRYIGEVYNASEQTYELVDNLLSWASIQLRNADPMRNYHSVKEICQATIDQLSPTAEHKHINIHCQISEGDTLYADKNMISTVVRNLLANAIKFTHQYGDIYIACEQKTDTICIHIKDSGIGIDEDAQRDLFRIDNQLSHTGTEGETGTGLGLALCKELIEKNNGTLGVNSERDNGSDFYFCLPRRQ